MVQSSAFTPFKSSLQIKYIFREWSFLSVQDIMYFSGSAVQTQYYSAVSRELGYSIHKPINSVIGFSKIYMLN